MRIGERIAQRRQKLDLSQEDLGFAIGTNQRQISRYERGENNPTGDVIVRIADVLNTTTDYLLGRTDYPDRPLRGAGDLAEDELHLVQMYRAKSRDTRLKVLELVRLL